MKKGLDRRFYRIISVVLLAICAMLVVSFLCLDSISKNIDEQSQNNLSDVAEQNVITIKKEIDNYYNLMLRIRSDFYAMEGDPHENILKLQEIAKVSNLLRVAFCDPDGMAYGSDYNTSVDLSQREFFQRGLQGKSTITGVLTDKIAPEQESINIITSPYYDPQTGELVSVFGITCYADTFNRLLQVNSFNNQGFSFATDENGDIIIGITEEGKNLSRNLGDLLAEDERNQQTADSILGDFSADTESLGEFYLFGQSCTYCKKCVSLLNDDVHWYVFSVVPTAVFEERLSAVRTDFTWLIVSFVVLLLICIVQAFLIAVKHRNEVEKIAYVDAVTHGDNFAMYLKRLSTLREKRGAFVAIDLVEFNSMRVVVGQEKSDVVLENINKIISEMLKENEIVAHVGRESFALFLSSTDKDTVSQRLVGLSERLLNFSYTMDIPLLRLRCGVYISSGFTKGTIEECYSFAGQAKEVLRKRDGGLIWFYSAQDNEKMLRDRELAGSFNYALQNREFEVWYQPKYDINTEKIVGAEALVRWRKNGELIAPTEFIPLFESNGSIVKLDEYIFRSVVSQQKARLAEQKPVLPISVNLSRATAFHANTTEKYLNILKDSNLDAVHVPIEITESAMAEKSDITDHLYKYKSAGGKIHLDDFGSGYSSMYMLTTKCFDMLKIDKSLVDKINSEEGETLVAAVIAMAHSLNVSVTAEGVETEEQLKCLRKLHCDYIQGYYFSKPLSEAEYQSLLDSQAEACAVGGAK